MVNLSPWNTLEIHTDSFVLGLSVIMYNFFQYGFEIDQYPLG